MSEREGDYGGCLVLALLVPLAFGSGCSAIGDLEKDALVDSVTRSVDGALEKRGLSAAQVKLSLSGPDGVLTAESARQELSWIGKQFAASQAKTFVDERVEAARTELATGTSGAAATLWNKVLVALGGLVSCYLGGTLYANAKRAGADKQVHARLAVVEALNGLPASSAPAPTTGPQKPAGSSSG